MAGAFNETKGIQLAAEVRVARSLWARFWGLMGRRSLAQDSGLFITPCSSVHTFFMRFPIDVIFLDKSGRVVKIAAAMKPWRTSLGGSGAHSALELNANTAKERQLEVGDSLSLPGR
jgi:uncharacterized membrane protein (UPF0127 family)